MCQEERVDTENSASRLDLLKEAFGFKGVQVDGNRLAVPNSTTSLIRRWGFTKISTASSREYVLGIHW